MIQNIIDRIEKENLEKVLELSEERVDKFRRPKVAIIATNPDDEPSVRYIKNKTAKMLEYGIDSKVYVVDSDQKLKDAVETLNNSMFFTSIIIQAPFGKGITMPKQEIFDMVNPEKDIDRLHSKWIFDEDFDNLPLTALGIYKVIKIIKDTNPLLKNVLMYGNGVTVNRRLFISMFNKGELNCRIVNSKTPKTDIKEAIEWSHLIVAGTGIPEILECKDKYVISPTLIKTENGWRSDLKQECRECNFTHPVLKAIGKLTVSALLRRAYEDAIKQNKI